VLKFYFIKHYFGPLTTFMGKWKDLEPDPDPYLCLMDPDPGGPKTCGSGTGSGSPKNGYLWSSLDERGAQSAPVCHSGQASHREQRTAPGDKDINYREFIKLVQKLVAALVSITVDKLLTESNERLQVIKI
jgi:hypothetical protein